MREPEYWLYANIPGFMVQTTLGQVNNAWAAVPMLLYNGQSPRRGKWFFYAYYPLHYYAVNFLVFCMAGPVVFG